MDKMKRILALALLLTIIAACTPVASPTPTALPQVSPTVIEATATPQPPKLPWWRDAVFYQIFVRSFNDSDGDGIGDFNGITQKLDYLQSLGVTAIWLMPIHPSPSYHGYDVINYYAVNPQYGTMADFKHLLSEAHARGMRVIIDLVLNHTSSQHPWFIDANSNPQSAYRDWYVWNDSYQGNHWYNGTTGYYYAFFSYTMPDLNYRNPAVTQQMEKMSIFWLKSVGVDGFRIDAAKHLVEEGLKLENTPSNHAWLKGYYASIKSEFPEAYTIGEIYGAGALVSKIYKDELDHIFNFEIASGAVNSANGGANSGINSAIKFALKDKPDGDYATFLTNHDQDRVMSVLRGDIGKAKVAASILMTAPGTPFIYYGEEIGMTGKKPDEYIRTPMQWNDGANAGFTTGTPWIEINGDYAQGVNVSNEEKDPGSLLNHYRALIHLRKTYSALRTGETYFIETGNNGVYALLRTDASGVFLIVINLKNEAISNYKLSLSDSSIPDETLNPESLLGNAAASPISISGGKFMDYQPIPTLGEYATYIFKIK